MADILFSERSGDELASGGVLRFNVVGGLLKAALTRAGGSTAGQIRGPGDIGGAGGAPQLSASLLLSRDELDVVQANRRLRADLNRILTNIGSSLVRKARRSVRSTNTIRTGLFLSSNKAEKTREGGRSFNTGVQLINTAPYAQYVHPKGRKGLTVAEFEFLEDVESAADEFIDDIADVLMPKIAAVISRSGLT